MGVALPHFLLFAESGLPSHARGWWRFQLEAVDGSARFEADDQEPGVSLARLELLAVIRGLESLEQPSRVTLVTASRYVAHGLRFGLEEWRQNGWLWERFGQMCPIEDADLWRRMDRASQIHRIECRAFRFAVEPARALAAAALGGAAAEMGQGAPAAFHPERGASVAPPAVPARRLGWFRRLTGARRSSAA